MYLNTDVIWNIKYITVETEMQLWWNKHKFKLCFVKPIALTLISKESYFRGNWQVCYSYGNNCFLFIPDRCITTVLAQRWWYRWCLMASVDLGVPAAISDWLMIYDIMLGDSEGPRSMNGLSYDQQRSYNCSVLGDLRTSSCVSDFYWCSDAVLFTECILNRDWFVIVCRKPENLPRDETFATSIDEMYNCEKWK